ncbi:MAG: DUF190 domain-containing protein, partial [Candidatus Nanopelagicales bacterium]
MTDLLGHALRLTITVGEDDTWRHRPVHSEIVVRAREAGLAGATVVRGLEGFGRRSVIHTSRLVSLSSDLPVVITIVDEPAKIRMFVPLADEVVKGGLITVEDVEVVKYVGTYEPDDATHA